MGLRTRSYLDEGTRPRSIALHKGMKKQVWDFKVTLQNEKNQKVYNNQKQFNKLLLEYLNQTYDVSLSDVERWVDSYPWITKPRAKCPKSFSESVISSASIFSERSPGMRVTRSKNPHAMEVDAENNNEALAGAVGTQPNITDSQETSPQIPSTSTTSTLSAEENLNEQMPRRRRKGENRHVFFGLPKQNYPDALLPLSNDAQLAEAIPNGTGSRTLAQNQEIQNPQGVIVNEQQRANNEEVDARIIQNQNAAAETFNAIANHLITNSSEPCCFIDPINHVSNNNQPADPRNNQEMANARDTVAHFSGNQPYPPSSQSLPSFAELASQVFHSQQYLNNFYVPNGLVTPPPQNPPPPPVQDNQRGEGTNRRRGPAETDKEKARLELSINYVKALHEIWMDLLNVKGRMSPNWKRAVTFQSVVNFYTNEINRFAMCLPQAQDCASVFDSPESSPKKETEPINVDDN